MKQSGRFLNIIRRGHRLVLTAIFLVLFLPLAGVRGAETEEPSIPFIRYDCLHRLLGGNWQQVYTHQWPDADRALYTKALQKVVEKDFQDSVVPLIPFFKRWRTPLILGSVKKNPKNGLIYFLLNPDNDDVMDANIVYVYDPENRWWICKTTVDLGS